MNPKTDNRNLTTDQQAQVEQWQVEHDQLQKMEDMAAILQDIATTVAESKTSGDKSTTNFATLLMDMRESLDALKNKQDPTTPDFSTPVVNAVDKLEKAFTSALGGLDVKPNVNVAAPNVSVDAPQVDLKGIESVLKTDIPKAFKQAIAAIPQPEKEAPLDLQPVLERLAAIETAARMKPQMPLTMKVTNPDGSVIAGSTVTGVTNDGTFAKETGGNLDEIALDTDNLAGIKTDLDEIAVDTDNLALIKAKTDNLDVALSTRLKPADTLTKVTTVDTITNPVAVTGTFWQTTQPTSEITGLMPKVYDYISANFSGATADVYTYKAGGSGGSTAATLTVNWTDSTKTVLSSVVRT